MSYVRLARALLHGHQYYGPALESLQGPPDRHRCFGSLVEMARTQNPERPLQVLEIGSWAGASAVSWAKALKASPLAGRVVCIDPWRPYFDLDVEHGLVYAAMNDVARYGDVLQLFLHNVRSAGVADIVDYRVGASGDILPQLEPASFDVIYVDGSHRLDDVLCDLSHAIRLVCEGGIVCGDDLELQRDAVDPSEHLAALASGRDYVTSAVAGVDYHPGVTEAVARSFGQVYSWNGLWAVRRVNGGWEWLEFRPGELPAHIADALREGDVPELVGETRDYSLVRLGTRYAAASKALGPVALGVERVGERDLLSAVLVGATLDEIRTRAMEHETPVVDVEPVGETEQYNLLRVEDRYIALARTLGDVVVGAEKVGERDLPPHVLCRTSLAELRIRVAEIEREALHVEPQLVGETNGYNLVRLGSRVVAVAKALGPLALGTERVGDRDLEPVILLGTSVDEVRARAEAFEPAVDLVEETRNYNLVRFGSQYVALARSLGTVVLGLERIGERELPPHILRSTSLEELRRRIAEDDARHDSAGRRSSTKAQSR